MRSGTDGLGMSGQNQESPATNASDAQSPSTGDMQNVILNMQKSIEQQTPAQIDPVVHMQYQQIMRMQLSEKLHEMHIGPSDGKLSKESGNAEILPETLAGQLSSKS